MRWSDDVLACFFRALSEPVRESKEPNPPTCDDVAPELELWAAILLQAIEDLGQTTCLKGSRKPSAKAKNLSAAARQWLTSTCEEIGGFCWICRLFDIDPISARNRILQASPDEIRRSLSFGTSFSIPNLPADPVWNMALAEFSNAEFMTEPYRQKR